MRGVTNGVYLQGNAVVSGFTVFNGSANAGGGVYGGTIIDCTIQGTMPELVTLEIVSTHGVPLPSVGEHEYELGCMVF